MEECEITLAETMVDGLAERSNGTMKCVCPYDNPHRLVQQQSRLSELKTRCVSRFTFRNCGLPVYAVVTTTLTSTLCIRKPRDVWARRNRKIDLLEKDMHSTCEKVHERHRVPRYFTRKSKIGIKIIQYSEAKPTAIKFGENTRTFPTTALGTRMPLKSPVITQTINN